MKQSLVIAIVFVVIVVSALLLYAVGLPTRSAIMIKRCFRNADGEIAVRRRRPAQLESTGTEPDSNGPAMPPGILRNHRVRPPQARPAQEVAGQGVTGQGVASQGVQAPVEPDPIAPGPGGPVQGAPAPGQAGRGQGGGQGNIVAHRGTAQAGAQIPPGAR